MEISNQPDPDARIGDGDWLRIGGERFALARVGGWSAADFAWMGQLVLLDIDNGGEVPVDHLCVFVMTDNTCYLKRKKAPKEKGKRFYKSINSRFDPLQFRDSEILIEFPVAGVWTRPSPLPGPVLETMRERERPH